MFLLAGQFRWGWRIYRVLHSSSSYRPRRIKEKGLTIAQSEHNVSAFATVEGWQIRMEHL